MNQTNRKQNKKNQGQNSDKRYEEDDSQSRDIIGDPKDRTGRNGNRDPDDVPRDSQISEDDSLNP
ncbi:MAG: hypothetical protein JWQ35_2138 [Bacteriovoracaceae bacterium]|nr:hypothetical protein [Bacteriovoracaceae bacterium]